MNFQPLKDFLDFYLPMLGIPGTDTVIYRNHNEIFRYQSGYDNIRFRTPVRHNALYNVYSITKIATAVAATQLIERGEILATDPVYAYFPEFKDITVKRPRPDGGFDIIPAKNTMLIKHLLTMTSGLDYNLERPEMLKVKEATAGRCPTLDMVRAMAKDPMAFEPGEGFMYGLSMDVVGGLVELVTGMSLGEYMRQNIFDPLGMTDTGFALTDERRNMLATQYQFDKTNRIAVEIPVDRCPYRLGTEYESGGAGLISSVGDQILLADALTHGGVGKNGNRILSSFGVKLMSTNHLFDSCMPERIMAQYPGYGYGYGVRVNLTPLKVGNLSPEGEFGWDGARLCYLSCDPANGISIFHAEHMGGLHSIVIPRLRNVIYSCIGE